MSQQSYKVKSAVLRGVEALPVEVEVLISSGIPSFSIVGMPDTAIQESRERVRAAIKSAGFHVPSDKIVVNLAPSSLRKTGSGFDLPIALALLAATGQIPVVHLETRSWWVNSHLKEGFVPRQGSFRISNARANWAQRS